jgi:hypothetical protein
MPCRLRSTLRKAISPLVRYLTFPRRDARTDLVGPLARNGLLAHRTMELGKVLGVGWPANRRCESHGRFLDVRTKAARWRAKWSLRRHLCAGLSEQAAVGTIMFQPAKVLHISPFPFLLLRR